MNLLTSRTLSVVRLILLLFSKRALSKEPVLPLCPTNLMDFLPQDLPMHCRMPMLANGENVPNLQNIKRPQRSPFPFPPGAGAMPPGAIPMPMPVMQGAPPAIPGSPVGPPMPMPMPMPGMSGSPGSKLPVIVMPFYSPDPSYKELKKSKKKNLKRRRRTKRRRRPVFPDTDSDTDTDTDSSDTDTSTSSDTSDDVWKPSKGARRSRRFNTNRKSRRNSKGRKGKGPSPSNILTPVLQYVTKDGYVIFEKEISKNEAKDWLSVNKDNKVRNKEMFVEKKNNQINTSKEEANDSGEMDETEDVEVTTHKIAIKEDKKNEKRIQFLNKNIKHKLTNRLPVVHKKKV